MAVMFVEGFEHGENSATGYNTTASRFPLWNSYNTGTNATAVKETSILPGSWSAVAMRFADTSATLNPSFTLTNTSPEAAIPALTGQDRIVGSFRFRFVTSLPSTNYEMFVLGLSVGSAPRLVFNTTDDKLYAAFDSNLGGTEEVAVSGVLVADTWYQVDFDWDGTTGTHTLKAMVDGANENTASFTQTAEVNSNVRLGSTSTNGANQATWLMDDLVLDDDGASYPLGPMKVYGLAPNSEGTFDNIGSFAQVGGTANDWWTSVDSWGSGGGTFSAAEYIEQNVNGVDYARLGFESLPSLGSDVVFGASIAFTIWASTTGANGASVLLEDGSAAIIGEAFFGDCSDTAQRYQRLYAAKPPAGGWSESAANALEIAYGGASAIPGNPRFGACILQVAVQAGVAVTDLPPKGRQLPLPVIGAVNRSRVY